MTNKLSVSVSVSVLTPKPMVKVKHFLETQSRKCYSHLMVVAMLSG